MHLLGSGLAYPQTVAQCGDPEPIVPVAAEGDDRLVPEAGGQVLVVVEAVAVVVAGGVALVIGAEPEVLTAVAEDGADLFRRYFIGESGIVLEQHPVEIALPAKHALTDDVEQQGVVIDGEDDVHVAAYDARFAADGFGQGFPVAAARVIYAQVAQAGEPEFPVASMAEMIGGERDGDRIADGKIAAFVDP